MSVFDQNACALGEGPLWHPLRKSLFWFDILNKKMLEKGGDSQQEWQFEEHFSAAGWVDQDTLLMASETGLWRFDVTTNQRDLVVPLEADNPITRSNDGRADPWGGFWIGSMGKNAERDAGAIYRFYKGELRQLVRDVTISNAICFAPDRSCAYYTDTVTQYIMRVGLDARDGWPDGAAEVFLDLKRDRVNPDGAVTDAKGNLWVAFWGAGRVACYGTDGTHLRNVEIPAKQPTCPAFGGADLRDLMVTSAAHGLGSGQEARDGMTFRFSDIAQGLPEPQVIL